MYPIGVLFGLGFDTATEVALLVLAGGAAGAGLPWYAILCLPVLFAAGMSLLDSIDGSFMNFAYGWAFSQAGAQGLLQPHDHGPVGRRRARHRHDRARRSGRLAAQPLRLVLELVREHQHQPARLRDRRHVRRHLGDRALGLALRTDRGALDGRPRATRPGADLEARAAQRASLSAGELAPPWGGQRRLWQRGSLTREPGRPRVALRCSGARRSTCATAAAQANT